MKRNLYTYTALLAALLLGACQSEQVEEQTGSAIIEFAVAMQPAATRGGVAVQNTMFDTNEEIEVYIKERNVPNNSINWAQPIVYKATPVRDEGVFYALADPKNRSGVVQTKANLAWARSNNVDIRAFYPKGVVNNLTDAHAFTVKNDQGTDASFRQSDLMAAERLDVARQDERVQLTFHHLLSKAVITLKGDRSLNINHEGWRDGATAEQQRAAQEEANSLLVGARVELVSILPGTTITSPNTLGTATGPAVDIHVGTIAATTERVDADDAGSAWQIACILPPQQIDEGTQMVRVTMADGGVLYYKPAAVCNFTSGHVNTYNLTVHAKEITLAGSTIDPWTAGDSDQGHEAQPVITM